MTSKHTQELSAKQRITREARRSCGCPNCAHRMPCPVAAAWVEILHTEQPLEYAVARDVRAKIEILRRQKLTRDELLDAIEETLDSWG